MLQLSGQLEVISVYKNSVRYLVQGGLPYETDGDARCLTWGCYFGCSVLLRVFQAKPQYFKSSRSLT